MPSGYANRVLTQQDVNAIIQRAVQYKNGMATLCSSTSPVERATFYSNITIPSELLMEFILLTRDQPKDVPIAIKSLCGLPHHFDNSQVAKANTNDVIKYLLNMSLWYVNGYGVDNRQKPLVKKWEGLSTFVNGKYKEALHNLSCCNPTATLTPEGLNLLLGASPGVSFDQWDTSQSPMSGTELTEVENMTDLPYLLRVMLGGRWRFETIRDGSNELTEMFHLPDGKATEARFRNAKKKTKTSIHGVYTNHIKGRRCLNAYMISADLNKIPPELLAVDFFPLHREIGRTLKGKILTAGEISGNDVIIGIHVAYLEYVSTGNAALVKSIRDRKERLEHATPEQQMQEMGHMVAAIRRGDGNQPGGRILRSTESGYEDVGDMFAAKVYVPHLCELLLNIPIKADSGGDVRLQVQEEVEEVVPPTRNQVSKEGLVEDSFQMASVGLSMFQNVTRKKAEEVMREVYPEADGSISNIGLSTRLRKGQEYHAKNKN